MPDQTSNAAPWRLAKPFTACSLPGQPGNVYQDAPKGAQWGSNGCFRQPMETPVCSPPSTIPFRHCLDAPRLSVLRKELRFLVRPRLDLEASTRRGAEHPEDLHPCEGCGSRAGVLRHSNFGANPVQGSRSHISYRHPISDPEYRGWS